MKEMTSQELGMFTFFYPDIDILQERDRKGNNLAHIIIKGFSR